MSVSQYRTRTSPAAGSSAYTPNMEAAISYLAAVNKGKDKDEKEKLSYADLFSGTTPAATTTAAPAVSSQPVGRVSAYRNGGSPATALTVPQQTAIAPVTQEEPEKKKGGLLDTIKNVVQGAAKNTAADWSNAINTAGESIDTLTDKLWEKLPENSALKKQIDEIERDQDERRQEWKDYSDELARQGQEHLTKAHDNADSKLGDILVDVGASGLQMAGDALIGTATGGVSALVPMFARVYGGSAREARQEGADLTHQNLYGVVSGGVEMLTEKMFDGLAGVYGAGAADDIVEGIIGKLTKTDLGRNALRTLFSAAGEGAEEAASDLVHPLVSMLKGLSWEEREKLDLKELGYDALVGAVSGGLIGGIGGRLNGQYNEANRALAESKVQQVSDDFQQTVERKDAERNGTTPQNAAGVSLTNETGDAGAVVNRTIIPYADIGVRNATQQAVHDRMVSEGRVIDLTQQIADQDANFPDLRSMPKKERTPILKAKMTALKETLRNYLNGLRGIDYSFDINGTTIEAQLYNTGIGEVLEKVTQEKAGMLTASDEIFRNAEYLYSTEDAEGRDTIRGWDYFYVPVQIGNDVVGVRIAVRNTARPAQSQIYNWGIKRDAALGGVGHTPNGSSSNGTSSAASVQGTPAEAPSIQNVPQLPAPVNSNSLPPVVDLFVPPTNNGNTGGTEGGGRRATTQSRYTDIISEGTPVEGPGTHEVHTDAQVDAEADARMRDPAAEKERLFGENRQAWNDTDTTVAQRLIAEARNRGDWQELARLKAGYEEQGTRWGQEGRQRRSFKGTVDDIVSEAAKLLYGETKTGESTTRDMTDEQKNEVMQKVTQMSEQAAATADTDTASLIEQIKATSTLRGTDGLFSKQMGKFASWALEHIGQTENGGQFLKSLLNAQIQGYAADFTKAGAVEKLTTWRMLSMLSKLSTIARNETSNLGTDLLETVSNNISLPLDMLLSSITGTRSVALDRSWFSQEKRSGSAENFLKSFLQVSLDAEFDGNTGKYEEGSGRTFKMGAGASFLERIISTLEKMEGIGLKSTDEFNKGGTEAEIQRGLDELKKRGLIKDDSLDNAGAEAAKKRTFQDKNKVSDAVLKLRDALNTFGVTDKQGNRIGLGSILIPFAQVPANVGATTARYNPVSGSIIAAKNLVQTLQAAKNGTLTAAQQREAVMSVGRAINGTALTALAVSLAAKGLLKVSGDDDKDKAALERGERLSGTQWNLSATQRWLNGESAEWQDGDDLMNIGFMEAFNSMLTLGSAIYDAYADDELSAGRLASESVGSVFQSVMELPAVSQISELVQNFKYSDADSIGGQLADTALRSVGSAASSFVVPNFVRGIAQGTDNTVRNTYSSGSTLGNAVDYIMAGVPGLRERLPSTVDSWGRERSYTDSDTTNFLNSNILPGQITQYNTNPVDEEVLRLFDEGYRSAVPDRAGSSTKINDEKLGGEAQRQFNVDRGSNSYDLLAELFNTNAYQTMSDEDKADAVGTIYSYSRRLAEGKAGSEKTADNWVVNAYRAQQSGQDVVGYLSTKAVYGSDAAGAYLEMTSGGIPSDLATGFLRIVDQFGGVKQANVYAAILALGLDDDVAEMLWNSFGYKTSYADFKRKANK